MVFAGLDSLSSLHRSVPSVMDFVSAPDFRFVTGNHNSFDGTSTWEMAPIVFALIRFPTYVKSLRHASSPSIFPCKRLLDCIRMVHRILLLTSYEICALALGEYPRNSLTILYICFYMGHWLVIRACKRLENCLVISMNSSVNAGV